MSNAMLRPICRSVHTGIFQSKEYRSLPSDGQARLLLLCLLIHPHGGTFHFPGLYHAGHETLREAASMPRRSFAKALGDLLDADLMEVDQENRLIWVPIALKLVGPPGNPNVAKGYARSLGQLPMSCLVAKAADAYRQDLQAFGPAFLEPFAKAFERISEGVLTPEKSLSEGFVKASDNSNKNRDINFYHYTNCADVLDRLNFLAFANRAGWVGVSEVKIARLLEEAPSLTMQTLQEFSLRIAGREDIRDPLAYLRSLYGKRQLANAEPEPTSPSNRRQSVSAADGAEMTFDD